MVKNIIAENLMSMIERLCDNYTSIELTFIAIGIILFVVDCLIFFNKRISQNIRKIIVYVSLIIVSCCRFCSHIIFQEFSYLRTGMDVVLIILFFSLTIVEFKSLRGNFLISDKTMVEQEYQSMDEQSGVG